MSRRITIEIVNKIATCLSETPVVCGNSDYEVEFLFDDEWAAHDVKTAMFIVNGKNTKQVFSGNVCKLPVVQGTLILWVGVFAGAIDDGTLSTTTPALVRCVPCITDGGDIPAPPPEDVYSQIIELLNEYIDKSENGATFIPSVSEEGMISWTNNKELPNPDPVNIKGEDGKDGIDGVDGKDGVNGVDGIDGVGIKDIKTDENGNLIITLTNNEVVDLGKIKITEEDLKRLIGEYTTQFEETVEQLGKDVDSIEKELAKTYELLHEVEITEETTELKISQDMNGQPLDVSAFYLFIEFPVSTAEKTLDSGMSIKKKGTNLSYSLMNFYTSKATSTTAVKYFFASGRMENGMWCDLWKSSQTSNTKDTSATKTFTNFSDMAIKLNYSLIGTVNVKFSGGNKLDIGTKVKLYGVRR